MIDNSFLLIKFCEHLVPSDKKDSIAVRPEFLQYFSGNKRQKKKRAKRFTNKIIREIFLPNAEEIFNNRKEGS